MKLSHLKELVKEIIKEVEGLTKQDRPGVMGAVNVEMTNPDGKYSDDMESGQAVKRMHNLKDEQTGTGAVGGYSSPLAYSKKMNEEVWDSTEEKRYANIGEWGRDNLEQDGTYKGEPLHNYGFIYKVGEKIPLTKYNLMNAVHLWDVAKKKRNDNLKLGKPAGIEEMTSTGAVAGYSTPYAFSKKGSGAKRAIDVTKKMGYKVVGPSPRV